MGGQMLGSKVIVQEEAPASLNVPALATAVVGAVLVTQKGPFGATRVTSFEQFVRNFGSFFSGSDSAAYVKQFFDEGGTDLWVSRVVHYSDPNNAASKTSAQASLTLNTASIAAQSGYVDGTLAGPFALQPGQTIALKIDGGGATTVTIAATAASRTSGNNGPFALANNDTLTLTIDGGAVQTVTFGTSSFSNIAAATPAEVAAVINAAITGAHASVSGSAVVITSDRKGTGSGVNITGGTANAGGKLNFTTGNVAGTGNVANIAAVTVNELKTAIELAVATVTVSTNGSGGVRITRIATGASVSVQVDAASTAALGLDNAVHSGVNSGTLPTLQVKGRTDGAFGNGLRTKISAATSGDADAFNLDVLDSAGIVLESWPNVSMVNTSLRYVVTLVNAEPDAGGSRYIQVVDLAAATPSPNDVPATGTFGPMTGGSDGLSGIADSDYIGSAAGKTGIRALDDVEDLTVLCVPGVATAAVQNAMISYCEVARGGQAFAVLGCPANLSETGVVTYVQSTAALKGLSEFGAFYWPRVKVSNPNPSVYGTASTITLDPSMAVAGLCSRVDNQRVGGIYDTPAGPENGRLLTVLGLETKVISGDAKTDYVFPKLVNPIVTRGGAIFVDGGRTLKDTGNFPWVNQRRGVSFIERSCSLAVDSRRHRNNTPALRAELRRGIDEFLAEQLQAGAFSTDVKEQAFFVDFGDALNPPSAGNVVTGRIGLAMATPAEFIVLKVSKLLGA